jgi:PAS domain S-box-containing protein
MTEHSGREKRGSRARGDPAPPELGEIIDTRAVQTLMDDFYRLTNIGVGVVDLQGRVLVATGWQEICTRFHRVHPETRKNCIQGDLELSAGVEPGTFKAYRCKNNLWDIATPIVIGGEHVGNLFVGQFFYEDETPDYDTFREQAKRYGFDEAAYLAALDRVPRWSRDTVDTMMRFCARLTHLISTLSHGNLWLTQALEDRDRAEKALQASELKYRALVEHAQDAIYVLQDGLVRFANATASSITGYTEEEILGKHFTSFLHPEDRSATEQRYRDRLAGNDVPTNYDLRILTQSGGEVWLQINQVVIEWEGRPATLNIARDVSGQRRAERARERLLSAIEQVAEAIIITDPEGAIQYVNPAFEEVTGYEADEVRGQNPRILKSGKQDDLFYRELWQTITGGKTWQGRLVNKRKDGTLCTEDATISPVVDATGSITNFVAVKRDITAEIDLEARLARAQKMEAVGTLAGGIAHDFNNILSAILGFTELVAADLPEGSRNREDLDEVVTACSRARDLVKQILAFSRRSEHEPSPLRMDLIVNEALKMLRSSLPSSIQINKSIKPGLPTVFADPTRIHQIMMNLCTNAAQAMEKERGTIEVTLEDIQLDKDSAGRTGDLRPGSYVRLEIRDSGSGMPEEICDRIFEPYFTTKKPGEGTGLGLAVVYGIVKDLGGDLSVESEVGRGTTFRIYLPAADRQEADGRPTAERSPLPMGTERILFIDDEPSIVKLGAQYLRRFGYAVTTRQSSREAVELFQSDPRRFDLIITDMTMPYMTGDELAIKVLSIRSDIPVILCTGYSRRITEAKARDLGIRALLMKPLTQYELGRTVRDVLDETQKVEIGCQ